jgi:phenylacetate-CoA ligase
MGEHYDGLETRDPQAREADFFAKLRANLAHAKAHAPYWRRTLAECDPAQITDRAALARLPVTRKSALIGLQKAEPPFGGLLAVPVGELARIFLSPGPILDPEGRAPDCWNTARGLYAAGFRKGDLVQNCMSYHLTPGARILESGLEALGCVCIPGGVGQTEQQVQVMAALKPRGYAGTPSFLRIILEKAQELNADLSSLKKAFVSGEALPPSLRKEFETKGIQVLQGYATADLGLVAYETPAREGLVVSENVLVEIVRPGTGDPVPDGEVGEVLVTNLVRDYPLVRFSLGDLSAVAPGLSPCGRTNMRIKGWMGRADQTTKVKGMFVHPEQVAEVVRRHPEIKRGRLVVSQENGADLMTLLCETERDSTTLVPLIQETLAAITKMRGEVGFVAPGSLPNDGKVIEDVRKFD